MIDTRKLQALNGTDISSTDKNMLVDVSSVQINTDLPLIERLENYLQQIKNPYLFRSGNLAVKVRFSQDGQELVDILTQYFVTLKKSY